LSIFLNQTALAAAVKVEAVGRVLGVDGWGTEREGSVG